jgi:ABC-type branched-subunit amino acid transport system ATPase component
MAANALILEANALSRRFGRLAAVDQVSINVCMGEIHAVIGTNGAGKSTLINMLSGELAPSDGTLQMHGNDITGWSQARRACRYRAKLSTHDNLPDFLAFGKLPPSRTSVPAAPSTALGICWCLCA